MFEIYNITHVEYPNLSDHKYLEIETFKGYEFNNCVAYEFAIRNDEVMVELERFEKTIQQYVEDEVNLGVLKRDINYYDYIILYTAGFDLYAMLYWLFTKKAKQISILSGLNNQELYLDFKKIRDKGDSHAYYKDIKPLIYIFNILLPSETIGEGLSESYVKINNIGICQVKKYSNGKVLYRKYTDDIECKDGWKDDVKIQDIDSYLLPSVTLTYKRPILKIIDNHEHFSLPLNLGIDKKNLLSYVAIIKDEYDRRMDIDEDSHQKFLESKSSYLNKIKKYLSKRITSLATIQGLNDLYKYQKRIFTISELFRDSFYKYKKPEKLGKLSANKVKELLYIYDYVFFANQFNKKLKVARDNDLELAETINQKNEIKLYYKNEYISISDLLDDLYRKLVKNNKKVPKNHKINQHYKLAKKLIDNQEYKFLI